jgi:hypothetical protein
MENELIVINDLTNELQMENCSINDIKEKISQLNKTRKSSEFAKLQKAIKSFENKKIDEINASKVDVYQDLLSQMETLEGNHQIIHKEIFKTLKNPLYTGNADKLLECTVQLELIAKIEPPASDKLIKQKLALEMLQSKFSGSKNKEDEVKDLLIDFINSLQSKKINASEKKLWKRVSEAISKLPSRLP